MNLRNFFFSIFLLFLHISVCLPYKWDSTTTDKNVRTFANFVDDLYENYKRKVEKELIMEIAKYGPKKTKSPKDDTRAVFNYTFVKWSAELAHFHVINSYYSGAYQNWNVAPKQLAENFGFFFYDQSLGHAIAEEFKTKIFSCKPPINKTVVNQIMQLIFSFAVRVILCVIYKEYFNAHDNVGGWQLKTLLDAYKKISEQSSNNNNHGIFPFQIIKTNGDEHKNHYWAETLNAGQDWLKSNEEQPYIENFKFILELSKFKLRFYDIFELLKIIIEGKTNEKEQQQPSAEIYNFLMESFNKRLPKPPPQKSFRIFTKKKPLKEGTNNQLSMEYAFFSFGRELKKQIVFYYDDNFIFHNCGVSARIYNRDNFEHGNTPEKCSKLIEMQLFKEPLWNYAYVIEIDGIESPRRWGISALENMQDVDPKVHYNEIQQLLTLSLSIGERFIRQLYEFAGNFIKNDQLSYEQFDFEKAIQIVASKDGQFKFEQKQNTISPMHNLQLFKWLFSLAIRFCTQMNGNDDNAGEYFKTFALAWTKCRPNKSYDDFFLYKMQIEYHMVKIYMPNWDLPYSVYSKNENELIDNEQQKVKNVADFLFDLSQYILSIKDVKNMADIRNKMPDDGGQIRFNGLVPEIYHFLSRSWNSNHDIHSKTLSIKGRFCIFENLVMDLWERTKKEIGLLPFITERDEQMKKQKCTEKRLKEETFRYFGVNKLELGEFVKINFKSGTAYL